MRVQGQRAARVAAAVAMVAAAASAANAQELLINGNFEQGEPNTAGAPGWNSFNAAFTSGEYARTEGGKSFKAFGPFRPGGDGAGAVQAVAATPGQAYTLTGFMFSPTLDRVQLQNFGVLELRFLDSNAAIIPGSGVQRTFTSSSTLDAWLPYSIDATAPANAASAEVAVVHVQINDPPTGGAVFWDDISLMRSVVATESIYVGTSGGNWFEPSNWQSGLVPNAIGAVANFNSSITAPSTVTANSPATVGTIRFNSANAYTLAGSGPLTLDVATGSAAITVTQGSHAINAPLVVNDSAVVSVAPAQTLTLGGALTLANGAQLSTAGSGTLRIAGPSVTGSAGASVRANGGTIQADVDLGTGVDVRSDAGEIRFNATQRVRSLAVAGGARATLADGAAARVLRTGSLAVDANATLDLGDNAAIVDYSSASPAAAIRAALVAGEAGNYAGTGITSSKAAADSKYAVGYAEANAVGSPATFAGESGIDSTTVLLRVTLKGDSDLTGTVNFDDLLSLAQNYNGTGKVWSQGDSDYNGAVDFDDLLALAQNYNQSALSMPEASLVGSDFAADFALAQSLVPEPATLTLLLGLGGLVTRRRR